MATRFALDSAPVRLGREVEGEGELAPEIQSKLLRVLETRLIRPIGAVAKAVIQPNEIRMPRCTSNASDSSVSDDTNFERTHIFS